MKAVFFDIDCTIISDDGKKYIPQSTKDTINMLRQNGCMTFINTGRVYCNVNPEIKKLGFNGYLCGCGTNIIVDGKELFHNSLDKDFCLEVAHMIRQCNLEPLYEHRDGIFFDNTMCTENHALRLKALFDKEGKDVNRGIEHPNFIFDKFLIWKDDTPNTQKLIDFLEPNFECIHREENGEAFMEVVPKGFTKSTAIDMVVKMFNINDDDLYAIGDGENDLPMLKAVKNSIAMKGNSVIYPYVSYITDTLYNDGIQKAMQHFKLI